MPYAVYKKGSGYKACKKGGGKCFSKKSLSKNKAEAQQKALYASEANESVETTESWPDRPDSVEGNVAYFNLKDCAIKVMVPEGQEDVTFSLEFQDPSVAQKFSQDDLEHLGNLALEAIRGDSPFKEVEEEVVIEEFEFEKLHSSILQK